MKIFISNLFYKPIKVILHKKKYFFLLSKKENYLRLLYKKNKI